MEKEYDNYLHLFNKRDSVLFNILAAHPNHALVKTTNLFPILFRILHDQIQKDFTKVEIL
jgi:hypothetical protein